MSVSDELIEKTEVLVLDREHPDIGGCVFALRRLLSDVTDRSFSKWAAAPERGRFIIFARIEGLYFDEILQFSDDAEGVISILRAHHERVGRRELNVGAMAQPDVHERIGEALRPDRRQPPMRVLSGLARPLGGA